MARPVKWITRLHEIQQQVLNSKIETWDRQAIENLFDVRRVTAQSLMRAIGELSNVAGAHLTSRASLLDFVDYVLAADDMDLVVRTRIDAAAAAPSQMSRCTQSRNYACLFSILFWDLSALSLH